MEADGLNHYEILVWCISKHLHDFIISLRSRFGSIKPVFYWSACTNESERSCIYVLRGFNFVFFYYFSVGYVNHSAHNLHGLRCSSSLNTSISVGNYYVLHLSCARLLSYWCTPSNHRLSSLACCYIKR
jgi:hypothetical protein